MTTFTGDWDSILAHDFEDADVSAYTVVNVNGTITSSTTAGVGQAGTRALALFQSGGSHGYVKRDLPDAQPELVVDFWVDVSDYFSGLPMFVGVFGDGGTVEHIRLRVNGGTLEAYRGGGSGVGTLLASAVVWDSTWGYDPPPTRFEMRVVLDDTDGVVEVLKDGVPVLSYEGDTRNGGAGGLDAIALGTTNNGPNTTYYDSLEVSVPAAASGTSYSDVVLADSPLAYYRLGESGAAGDPGTPLTGTATTAQVTGPVTDSYAFTLNGTSDKLQSFVDISDSKFTIETWFKTTDSQGVLASDRGSGTGLTLLIGAAPVGGAAGKLSFGFDGAGLWIGVTSANTYNDGAWHHVVAVWDGTSGVGVSAAQLALYVDGAAVSTTSSTTGSRTAPITGQGGFSFGKDNAGIATGYFAGSLSRLALYRGVALSSGDVAAHFAETTAIGYDAAVAANSPTGFWKLDDATTPTTVMVDSSGNGRDGSYTDVALETPGLIVDPNTAATFNGSSSHGDVPHAAWMDSPTALTIEGWIKTTSTGIRSILDRDLTGNRVWQFRLNGGSLEFIRISGGTAIYAGSLNDGNPHHVAATYDGASIRLYVDGALVTTQAAPGTLTGAAPFTVGANRSGGYAQSFSGAIDEVTYYGTVLSPARIQAHYLAGQTLLTPYAEEVLDDSPLAYYRLGESSGTTMVDSSGNGRDGTYVGSPTLGVPGLITDPDTAADFSGANYGQAPAATWMQPAQFTAECWASPDVTSGSHVAMSRVDFNTSVGSQWSWYIIQSGNRYACRVFVNGGGLASSVELLGPTDIAAGDTYHLALTYDGSAASLYINGALATSAALIGSASPSPTINLTVGAEHGGNLNERFDGALDEIAYYGTALSAARIAAHYAAGTGTGGETVAGAVAEEGDAALTGTVIAPSVIAGDVAEETDEAPLGAVPTDVLVEGATAAETDTPLPGATVTPTSVTGSTALETDEAPPGAVVVTLTTDRSNMVGGRIRQGFGTVIWEPPVVVPPSWVPDPGTVLVAQSFSVPVMEGHRPVYDVQQVQERDTRDRIIIGGKDVTYFRGIPTPFPGFTLIEPLLYGATQITFPQIAAAFERPGVGDLRWLRPFATVVVQRVDVGTGAVVATDYRGLVISFDSQGGSLSVQVGGEATGRGALQQKQPPLFTGRNDLGYWAFKAIQELGLALQPRGGPTTGVKARNWGGQSMLEYLNQIVAMSWGRSGNRWTIMPTRKGVYQMLRKDTETIKGTVYADDTRTVATLKRDLAEEPNRLYMTGVNPQGMRVRFGAYPGLMQTHPPRYPFDNGAFFGPGTTDEDTDTGDGISVMITRLRTMEYLDFDQAPGGYDADVVKAIQALQRDADIDAPTPGNMNERTWEALFDIDVTGFSLRWSSIQPAAARQHVQKWQRSASGAIMRRNPRYDPTMPKVDRTVDAGTGFGRAHLREWAQAQMDEAGEDNWIGSITFNTGALVRGIHVPGTELLQEDLLPARDLMPGDNLWLPLFDGGTTVHVAAVTVSPDGLVSADVDTRARDAMEVWEINTRNRESRRSPYRDWLREHRSSTETKDSTTPFDEVGGVLYSDVSIEAEQWTVFPVVAGEAGTIGRLRLRTNPDAEFVVAVFGQRIYPGRLRNTIGNPLTPEGTKRWENESILNDLTRDKLMLYVAGNDESPCGYYPKSKAGEDDEAAGPAPLTGKWEDDAGFSYYTGSQPILWVAVFSDRDTVIPSGRIMWPQLEAGT